MDISYVVTPLLAWLITGIIKFIINSIRVKRFAIDLVGYGGMPSNHSAIVSSCLFFVGYKEGVESSVFTVALTLAFIVMLDAASLRKHIEKQSKVLNELSLKMPNRLSLRERIGHSKKEIAAGALLGFLVATFVSYFTWFFVF